MIHSFYFILSDEDMLPMKMIHVEVTDQNPKDLEDQALEKLFQHLEIDETRLDEFDSMYHFIKFDPAHPTKYGRIHCVELVPNPIKI